MQRRTAASQRAVYTQSALFPIHRVMSPDVDPAPAPNPRMLLVRLHVQRVAIELQIKALREAILREAGAA